MKKATAEELEKMFEDGIDMTEYMDLKNIQHIHPQPKQISITIPPWLVDSLDKEAERRGIARKAMINTALVEWVDELNSKRSA